MMNRKTYRLLAITILVIAIMAFLGAVLVAFTRGGGASNQTFIALLPGWLAIIAALVGTTLARRRREAARTTRKRKPRDMYAAMDRLTGDLNASERAYLRQRLDERHESGT